MIRVSVRRGRAFGYRLDGCVEFCGILSVKWIGIYALARSVVILIRRGLFSYAAETYNVCQDFFEHWLNL